MVDFKFIQEEKEHKPKWNPIKERSIIPIQQLLYLTVQSKKDAGRIVLEGYTEDDKWFNSEGVSLDVMGYEVLAWIEKRVPDIYLED